MKTQTNAEAVRDFKRYLDAQAPMVIKPTPKHFVCTEEFVLVVASAPSFVISEFPKIEDAESIASATSCHSPDWVVNRSLPQRSCRLNLGW